MQTMAGTSSINTLLQCLEDLKGKLHKFQSDVEYYKKLKDSRSNLVGQVQGLQALAAGQEVRNGVLDLVQQKHRQLLETEEDLKQKYEKFQLTIERLKQCFEELLGESEKLVESLSKEKNKLQHQMQLKHGELAVDVEPDELFESFALCCAETGNLLRDIQQCVIPRFENIISDFLGSATSHVTKIQNGFHDVLCSLYSKTFLVTEQGGWNVKKGIKCPPKVKVRMLAAHGYYPLGGTKVDAMFVQEKDINECYSQEKDLDLCKLKEKKWEMDKGGSSCVKFASHTSEAVFDNILLKFKSGRTNVVSEEKYRLVFYTRFEGVTYWTLSLPLVVTTATNQHCECLASIMFQCFGTDVFTVPIESRTEMEWPMVSEMLQAKIKKVFLERTLSEENLLHLKARLMGDASEDEMCSLYQFCRKPLLMNKPQESDSSSTSDKIKEVSFWKWFLSIYNLLRADHVREYWENGYIIGFLSKEMAEIKLKESRKYPVGTFLLRFSDHNITNSQGKDTMFGKLASSMLFQNNVVFHLETFDEKKLRKCPLATRLMRTTDKSGKKIYRYVYPQVDTPCEELFKGIKRLGTKDPHDDGYLGVTDLFMINLEQSLYNLSLRGKRTSTQDLKDVDDLTITETTEPKRLRGSPALLSESTPSIPDLCNPAESANTGQSLNMVSSNTIKENETMNKEGQSATPYKEPMKTGSNRNKTPADRSHSYPKLKGLLENNEVIKNTSQKVGDDAAVDCLAPHDMESCLSQQDLWGSHLPTVITDINSSIENLAGSSTNEISISQYSDGTQFSPQQPSMSLVSDADTNLVPRDNIWLQLFPLVQESNEDQSINNKSLMSGQTEMVENLQRNPQANRLSSEEKSVEMIMECFQILSPSGRNNLMKKLQENIKSNQSLEEEVDDDNNAGGFNDLDSFLLDDEIMEDSHSPEFDPQVFDSLEDNLQTSDKD